MQLLSLKSVIQTGVLRHYNLNFPYVALFLWLLERENSK